LPLLAILLVGVPLLEIWALVRVADLTGWGTALGLLVVMSVAGAVLLRREGAKAWRAFAAALSEGRLPAAEVVDGALVIVGGALMLTPGFVTDAVGLLCVLPPSRALVNRALRRQVRGMLGVGGLTPWGSGTRSRKPPARTPPADPGVIDVEVVDVRRDDPSD
jgi:UPF0716 protein FxsA